MIARIHAGMTLKTRDGERAEVKAVLRNGRFFVVFAGGSKAWFNGWQKSHFSGVQS